MKIVDLNVLLYAVNASAPQHAAALKWWERTLNGDEQVGLAWPILLGFLRLTTRPGLLPRPLKPRQALQVVGVWLAHPMTTIVHPGDAHWSILQRLLEEAGMAGNLTTDAHLAALALEYRATLCSTDADFGRFRGLERQNPLERSE